MQAGLEEDKFVPEHGTYIASSYVKFVESGGARVVPILADTPPDVVRGYTLPAGWWTRQGAVAGGSFLLPHLVYLHTRIKLLGFTLNSFLCVHHTQTPEPAHHLD